ncbi:hypothetical protein N322_04421, partial [Cariama cristata]
CQEFEGMCCMNLSDHSRSIHKQLQLIKKKTKTTPHITYEEDPLKSWI